jgi:hypothetical protein
MSFESNCLYQRTNVFPLNYTLLSSPLYTTLPFYSIPNPPFSSLSSSISLPFYPQSRLQHSFTVTFYSISPRLDSSYLPDPPISSYIHPPLTLPSSHSTRSPPYTSSSTSTISPLISPLSRRERRGVCLAYKFCGGGGGGIFEGMEEMIRCQLLRDLGLHGGCANFHVVIVVAIEWGVLGSVPVCIFEDE